MNRYLEVDNSKRRHWLFINNAHPSICTHNLPSPCPFSHTKGEFVTVGILLHSLGRSTHAFIPSMQKKLQPVPFLLHLPCLYHRKLLERSTCLLCLYIDSSVPKVPITFSFPKLLDTPVTFVHKEILALSNQHPLLKLSISDMLSQSLLFPLAFPSRTLALTTCL